MFEYAIKVLKNEVDDISRNLKRYSDVWLAKIVVKDKKNMAELEQAIEVLEKAGEKK